MLPPMADAPQRMVWVDLEMTGLEPETCVIVEIATIVTDAALTVIAEGPCLVIHQPEAELARMNAYVRDLHTRGWHFYKFIGKHGYRLMCSWESQDADVAAFLADAKAAAGAAY